MKKYRVRFTKQEKKRGICESRKYDIRKIDQGVDSTKISDNYRNKLKSSKKKEDIISKVCQNTSFIVIVFFSFRGRHD